jgi:hypothetical protein
MALSTCRDCNREVSTLARHCVHCGRPRPAGFQRGSLAGGIIVAALALALTGVAICTAKRACVKYSSRMSSACETVRERVHVAASALSAPRAADKAEFVKSLESEEMELVEVGNGLYRLQRVAHPAPKAAAPAPAVPVKERY